MWINIFSKYIVFRRNSLNSYHVYIKYTQYQVQHTNKAIFDFSLKLFVYFRQFLASMSWIAYCSSIRVNDMWIAFLKRKENVKILWKFDRFHIIIMRIMPPQKFANKEIYEKKNNFSAQKMESDSEHMLEFSIS